jgi:NAD(P)-dependent dehydrogenase (short-subunit alcohol dehydrogenase family)
VRLPYILAALLLYAHLLSPSFSIYELLKTKGQVVIVSSGAAQLRIPNASDYCISKFAIGRFAEFIALGEPDSTNIGFHFESVLNVSSISLIHFTEYPDIKVFSICPGAIKTNIYDEFGANHPLNSTLGLASGTILYLTSGKADYLSGRFVSVRWDLGEVERDWKEKIVAENGLVNKLFIPA